MGTDFLADDDSLDPEKLRAWVREQSQEAEPGWIFDFPKRGAELFEALPDQFSFDELLERAERLGIAGSEAVEHFRVMQREEMVTAASVDRWCKNEEARPYF